jgi:hypothetical protein
VWNRIAKMLTSAERDFILAAKTTGERERETERRERGGVVGTKSCHSRPRVVVLCGSLSAAAVESCRTAHHILPSKYRLQ